MFELLSEIPFVSLFIKFMIASTVLLGAVWLMEKVRLINTPDLAELAWKTAIAGSFVALLPIADIMSSTWVIEDGRTAALIEDLNENRPLSELAPERERTPEPLTITIDSTSGAALLDAKRAIEAAQARLNETTTDTSATTGEATGQNNGPLIEFAGRQSQPSNADPKPAFKITQSSAADANNALILTPEYDSESTQENTFWYSAADLRTKDLAALGWIGLVLLTVGALMISYRDAVKNLGSRQRVQAEDKANKTLRAICEKADIRHVPYLSRSGAIKSPVCLPRKEICLPNWAFDDMPEAEFKSLLAHELGHMVRRDPIMLMALQILSRTFFFQPLFIIARKRLTDIAELAADEWAAEQASDSRAVANALFTCATKIHETRQIQWGLAMAGNKSILKQRVERLIHAQSVPFKSAGTLAKSALGVGVIGLSLGMPSVEFAGAMTAETATGHDLDAPQYVRAAPVPEKAPIPQVTPIPRVAPTPKVSPSAPKVAVEVGSFPTIVSTAPTVGAAHPHGRYHVVDRDSSSGNMNWHDGDRSVSVKWDGDFRISEDESFIQPEDDDGYLRIRTKEDGEKRSIRFKVEDGKRVHVYKVNGKEQELDADGKKWLKDSIRVLIETGFGAEERVARILKKSKVKGVLKEVKSFKSNYVKRIYLTELMDQAKLSNKEVGQVIDLVGKLGSDFEKRLILSVMLEEEKVSDKMLPKVLAVAKGMSSDFEKRLLVTHYVSEMKLNQKSIGLILDIAESINSDFELRLLLTSALDDAKLDDKGVDRILDMAIKRIDSDFEKRLLLSSFADEYDRSDKTVSKLLDAAKTIDSDFERRVLLATIINEAKLNETNWLKAIDIAADIDSDFEKARALQQIKSEVPEKNEKIQTALDKALASVKHTDHARTFVEFSSDFALDFATDFTADYAEAMAELAEELTEMELEHAEIIRELSEEDSDVARDAIREHSRMLRNKQREMRNVLKDQARVEREVARAEQQAVRQIERELRRVEKQLSNSGRQLKRELSQVMRELERSKRELERNAERRAEKRERHVQREEERRAEERAREEREREREKRERQREASTDDDENI